MASELNDILKETIVMVLAGGQGERLYPLTRHRAKPAVPFGGLYRIVDFALSNCLNSGMRRVKVLTQYKSDSLHRHIRLAWNVFNPELDEYVEACPPQQRISKQWYEGTAHSIYQNIYTLDRERPRYVVVLAGDHVYKMNYTAMLREHLEKGADLTIGCVEAPREEATRFGVMTVDNTWRIVKFEEKPEEPDGLPGRPDRSLCSMGIYVFTTDVLVRRVIDDAKHDTSHDFGRDVIPAMIRTSNVFAHRFTGVEDTPEPYWRDIGTLDAYWQANMDLAGPSPEMNLFDENWPIRSQLRQIPPAKVLGAGAAARDALVSPGCRIVDARVERSVLSPSVRVGPGSEVTDAILLDGVEVGRNCRIRRAIIDKSTRVPDGVEIGVDPEHDAREYTVSQGGIVAVPKEMPIEPPRKS
jgi:glucose-1-phosphate adenylyltransferase